MLLLLIGIILSMVLMVRFWSIKIIRFTVPSVPFLTLILQMPVENEDLTSIAMFFLVMYVSMYAAGWGYYRQFYKEV